MKKVIVSTGFGADWSSWSDKPQQVAEYKPIIEFLENGGDTSSEEFDALVEQMKVDLGLDYFYDGGKDGLVVKEVSGLYAIHEYDGAEYLVTNNDLWG